MRIGCAALAAILASTAAAAAGPTLEDYRHFRALSIDLDGRMPSPAELAAFEQPGFDLGAWIDQRLQGPAYVDRLTRIYLDLLRLQVGATFQFVPAPVTLRRVQVLGPDGNPLTIYFRAGQRRVRPETDGEFCLDQAETGLQFPRNSNPTGTPIIVTQAVLDQFTAQVYPWWLYYDYDGASPAERFGPDWQSTHPGFTPVDALVNDTRLTDAGTDAGSTPIAQIRVCKEEAQTVAAGTIYASGRTSNPPAPPPYGRLTFPPLDSAYARAHKGEPIDCTVGSAFTMSADCGCGPGLERCLPGASSAFDPPAFAFSSQQPLGFDQTVDQTNQTGSSWSRVWWGEEASHFFGHVLENDLDFRDVLTAKYTTVNGPLAQFYKAVAPSTCCGQALNFGLARPEPLFDPAGIPATLKPQDAMDWRLVDRGARASGILTMPVFLTKFGSRRARAHVLYNAFLCRDFVAATVQLTPSTEPNLMIRPGCATCHVRLEPMSAYFTRVQESDWTWLPGSNLPLRSAQCRLRADGGAPGGGCGTFYDPAFGSPDAGLLRGAYGAPDHADQGPIGLAQELTADEQFPGCVAQNVASAFLGRALTVDDADLKQQLADAFVKSGYKMSKLVKALVASPAYARANNLNALVAPRGTP